MAESNRLLTLPVKWLKHLSPLLLLLAIMWLCWGLSRIVWLVVSPPQAPNVEYLPRQAEVKPQNSNMGAFTIFKNPVVAITKQAPVKKVKPTNMLLKGVMEASPMSNSSAMIEVSGEIKNYRVGSEIEETGYTLGWVDWNKIIIEDSEQTETIIKLNEPMELDQEFVAKNGNNGRSSRKTKNHSSSQSPGSNSRTKQSSSKSKTAHNTTQSNTTKSNSKNNNHVQSAQATSNNKKPKANSVDRVIAELTNNPSGYLSKMGVMATNEGYSVTDAMPANIRNKIGLQSGDKVLSVNGNNVGKNPAQDAQILKQVQKSGQAQIQVQRGQQIITIRQQFNR